MSSARGMYQKSGFAEEEEERLKNPRGLLGLRGRVWSGRGWRKVGPEVFFLRLISILGPSRFDPTHSALLWSALLWAHLIPPALHSLSRL